MKLTGLGTLYVPLNLESKCRNIFNYLYYVRDIVADHFSVIVY